MDNTVDFSPIVQALVGLAAAVITGAVPILLAWARAHWRIMQDVGMNEAITAAAGRSGALLTKELKKFGEHPAEIELDNPILARYARRFVENYPKFTTLLGADQNKVANIILAEANRLVNQPAITPVPVPTETQPTRSSRL